ncbi:unnamed protein product [Bursaphelenchus xylophilus]|uniref:(pine wood nematode) hypothetical protein n=1 Tax=Bursaphelenchus xylophilus TaxID=6326 RepID=A0A1I7RIR5_BURXY|nr:unnamed protein product [Bursaphelenchus xylophilus]CAG9119041.1 unnamed protein product [Bursaphelenchus xylophilus]
MLTDDAFQMLLFDLFCMWHDVQRHYDPPITHTEEEKMFKVKKMICKLLGEIDSRVFRIQTSPPVQEQEFIEEWTMLTWNVMCITSRLQQSLNRSYCSSEDKVILNKLNDALIKLVNHSRSTDVPASLQLPSHTLSELSAKLGDTVSQVHGIYERFQHAFPTTPPHQQEFLRLVQAFNENQLGPFIDYFKSFCNEQSVHMWADVRAAQIRHMVNYEPMSSESINRLVSFYSYMMHKLAVLGARLQGLRHVVNASKVFGDIDPVGSLSDNVFSALELLMSDCVLATEPSNNAILVTNNLFAMNCGALARGVVFKQFEVQVVTEEAAEHIQSEMRRQKMLQQPSPIAVVPSAALLAMKPTSGTKRANSNSTTSSGEPQGNTAHKKSDVNSKDMVVIYPAFNSKNRYWAATYPQLLCTTRQKGRQSTNNSFQDLSPSALANDLKSHGKRPIFYFHITATMFSPSGRFATAHTLSLPFTIATRRNQDCQVQRMMSSYTATCFWLYGTNAQDGLLLQWQEYGMHWDHFMQLFKQHFRVNADVQRGLKDSDFDLLRYKLQCNDCTPSSRDIKRDGRAQVVTFKNMLCPHLRYECGNVKTRFSVWRGMLELLQIFQDQKTNVRKLWEKNLIMGFLEFDQVAEILADYDSAIIMRLSFVTGGTICFTVKSHAHSLTKDTAMAPMHLEPLDLKKLQAKCLKDYLRDIGVAEKVKYVINSNFEPVLISEVIEEMKDRASSMEELETSRHVSSNVTHSGDLDAMQHITFTAMRIAVVTCKVKPPSADMVNDLEHAAAGIKVASPVPPAYNGQSYTTPTPPGSLSLRLPANATSDDFPRELVQLCNFHGKSKLELIEMLDQIPDSLFSVPSTSIPAALMTPQPQQYSPPIIPQMNPPNLQHQSQSAAYSHMSTPSPMNTSPSGSTNLQSVFGNAHMMGHDHYNMTF